MRILDDVTGAIGRTPLVKIGRLCALYGAVADVLVKLERSNPGGSVKDRAALSMINDAELRGLLAPGATVVEPTSGNTGVGLAMICAARGYRLILTMPDSMSAERRKLLSAYGAALVLTPGALGMQGAIDRADAIAAETRGSFMPRQFDSAANAEAHRRTTGPEIYEDTGGAVDFLVAGVGTGGTITGAGSYLKEKKPSVRAVAVEPADSPVLSLGRSGPHPLQGIGAGFVPATLDRSVIDEVIAVGGPDAMATGRALARREGILAGISSGAAVFAALEIAKRPENKGRQSVAVLPDTGERYLSTDLFTE